MNLLPTYLLKRHPLEMEAHFDFVLVLTYAFPQQLLEPLLPPGLVLDTFEVLAFLAVAIVQTRGMKPRGLPDQLGQDYLLVGYRLFVRYQTLAGQHLRGLKILRSDTDKNSMVAFGNLLTHYGFKKADIQCSRDDRELKLDSKSDDGVSDLSVIADLTSSPDYLPPESPFSSVREALKFAGPMPFTFDYEEETHSIIRVEGVRKNWHPTPVAVQVKENKFLELSPFSSAVPRLCSAFYVLDIPYYWKSAIGEVLPRQDN